MSTAGSASPSAPDNVSAFRPRPKAGLVLTGGGARAAYQVGVIKAVRDTFERAALGGDAAVLLTSPQIRPYVRSIIERFRGQTVVMSQNEVHARAKLKTVGAV